MKSITKFFVCMSLALITVVIGAWALSWFQTPRLYEGSPLVVTVNNGDMLKIDKPAQFTAVSEGYFLLDDMKNPVIRGVEQELKPAQIDWNSYWSASGTIPAGEWKAIRGWVKVHLIGEGLAATRTTDSNVVSLFTAAVIVLWVLLNGMFTLMMWSTPKAKK